MSRKSILLYQGGRYSSKDVAFKHFKNILTDYAIDTFEDVQIFNSVDFFGYIAAIFYSQEGELTNQQEMNILKFINAGRGFIGLHGASASFKSNSKYFEMLGGRFIGHKRVKSFKVTNIDKEHPITSGFEDFTVKDEPYRHEFSMSKDLRILAEADYQDIDNPNLEPIMWTKPYGEGRVFYCSLGHRTNSLKSPIFQEIIQRAVKWVIKS
ncbi:MAG: ThuA domain-containing protein [Candidatus Hermodarchaeota archaeon]